MLTVISLGGSIVAPDAPDTAFIKDFTARITRLLEKDPARSFIFVVGGGGPARAWQAAYRGVCTDTVDSEADWIGIMATRLNARLIKAVMGDYCKNELVIDPTDVAAIDGRVLVAAGWKPGFSTDFDAVVLAERFGADMVINLSNIAKVYTDDPKKNPAAKPIDAISWQDFRAMVGDEWVPGKNVPFDPVASRKAAELKLKVICAAGRDLDNLEAILEGRAFTGTAIG